jgi:hypothetical protein
MAAVREYERVTPVYGEDGLSIAEQLASEAALLLDQRVDIINAVIEDLVLKRFELPAFRTLDEIAERAHADVQVKLFAIVTERLTVAQRQAITTLLDTDLEHRQSEFNDLKKSARRPTRKHLEILLDHLEWLDSIGDMDVVLAGFSDTKIRFFCEQAMNYDVSELKECAEPKRYTLIVALIHRMQVRARDQLAEMFLRRVATIHKRAKDDLEQIRFNQREEVERLICTLDDVLTILELEPDNAAAGGRIRDYLLPEGGTEPIRQSCAKVQATSGNNYLPLVWKQFKSHRSILFRLVHLLDIQPTSQDRTLIDALDVIKSYQDKHRIEWIDEPLNLTFASDRWRKLLRDGNDAESFGLGVSRRNLEICVFSYLAEELRSGDLCIEGSEEFADYRKQLLSWEECQALLPAYCEKVGLPDTAAQFVETLRNDLTKTAEHLDAKFPECHGDISLNAHGEPVLRKPIAREIPTHVIALQNALSQRMPSRHVLDVLTNIEHWMRFSRHFGPLSGNETKLKQPVERYLMTIFAMGCNLGKR